MLVFLLVISVSDITIEEYFSIVYPIWSVTVAYVSPAPMCCRTSSDLPDILSRRKLKQLPPDQDLP